MSRQHRHRHRHHHRHRVSLWRSIVLCEMEALEVQVGEEEEEDGEEMVEGEEVQVGQKEEVQAGGGGERSVEGPKKG